MDVKYDPILGSLRESDTAPGIAALAAINTANSAVTLEIDFLDLTPFVYNSPFDFKFENIDYEDLEPTVSPDVGEEYSQFDKVTITPASVGLVILKGVLI